MVCTENATIRFSVSLMVWAEYSEREISAKVAASSLRSFAGSGPLGFSVADLLGMASHS
jgi:hypothetical protein